MNIVEGRTQRPPEIHPRAYGLANLLRAKKLVEDEETALNTAEQITRFASGSDGWTGCPSASNPLAVEVSMRWGGKLLVLTFSPTFTDAILYNSIGKSREIVFDEFRDGRLMGVKYEETGNTRLKRKDTLKLFLEQDRKITLTKDPVNPGEIKIEEGFVKG